MSRFLLPAEFDEASLLTGLAPCHGLVIASCATLEAVYLDTFDWRLYNSGFVLVEERGHERRLVLLERDREPYSIATRTTPRMATDLPAGHLADTIGPVMGSRALIPVGAARVDRRDGRIENADGEMLARLRFDRTQPLDRSGEPLSEIKTLEIRGGPIALTLGATGGLTAAGSDLAAVAAARGRSPGDYSSKFRVDLDPAQPADTALRAILLILLTSLEANVEGTVNDLDIEFLHDLRVACRRTRSALTQLKGVLPEEITAPFNAEFKWLGNLTGSLRDLDVYLLEIPAYRALLPAHASADLDALEELIRSTRARTLTGVVEELRSARFERLVAGWRRVLEAAGPSSGPLGSVPAIELAGRRIDKAHRRILKHGGGLDHDPPAETMHRLRIDGKKLRYLLEFFSSLYPAAEIDARIKELKRIQDILGGFNDMVVQRRRLAEFARELRADPDIATSCILTMGRLAGILEERQEQLRLTFHDAFAEFSGGEVGAAYGRLFSGKEST
jgi:CHAD domain-containing protein